MGHAPQGDPKVLKKNRKIFIDHKLLDGEVIFQNTKLLFLLKMGVARSVGRRGMGAYNYIYRVMVTPVVGHLRMYLSSFNYDG